MVSNGGPLKVTICCTSICLDWSPTYTVLFRIAVMVGLASFTGVGCAIGLAVPADHKAPVQRLSRLGAALMSRNDLP